MITWCGIFHILATGITGFTILGIAGEARPPAPLLDAATFAEIGEILTAVGA